MMRLQGYSDMGGIDAVFQQFAIGTRNKPFNIGRRVNRDQPVWQTPKLASSISHVFGKQDDMAMVEIFGARGQDLAYSEMKWWTDHMHVSGVNFMIPHSFNPRAPNDRDCPPYFYMDQYEPRWPLYRVYADYTSRLSVMLTGGRHVCPVAQLFMGQSDEVGRAKPPEDMATALQDGQIDSDWLPYEVFERGCRIAGKELQLHAERYRVLVVPPVEVIPHATLVKIKEFFAAGGVVAGYGFLPSRSATLGKNSTEIVALCQEIWGDKPVPGLTACKTSAAGGRSYLLTGNPSTQELQKFLADAGVVPTLQVLDGETNGWLHVLHRVKDGRDVFLVCNQNHLGEARRFTFRVTAAGEPECWDPMRNEIAAMPLQRIDEKTVELSLTLEPSESVLLVFQPKKMARPARIEADAKPVRAPIVVERDPNPASVNPVPANPAPNGKGKPRVTISPVAAADPFRGRVVIPADVDLARCRVCLEMDDLPDDSAAVTVNGAYAGGVIGKPLRLDITSRVKPGNNTVLIEPLTPKAVRLVFLPSVEP
jgi:hypothetical protein